MLVNEEKEDKMIAIDMILMEINEEYKFYVNLSEQFQCKYDEYIDYISSDNIIGSIKFIIFLLSNINENCKLKFDSNSNKIMIKIVDFSDYIDVDKYFYHRMKNVESSLNIINRIINEVKDNPNLINIPNA